MITDYEMYEDDKNLSEEERKKKEKLDNGVSLVNNIFYFHLEKGSPAPPMMILTANNLGDLQDIKAETCIMKEKGPQAGGEIHAFINEALGLGVLDDGSKSLSTSTSVSGVRKVEKAGEMSSGKGSSLG
ncbi:MAG: hypothetical protein ISQ34_01235 [Rickettsiales bacterium]|nr:hypothetical protein [Rickettsiales bacterium]